jgi:hypothetical protein
MAGKIALWVVVAVALISGAQYFAQFLRRIVSFSRSPEKAP